MAGHATKIDIFSENRKLDKLSGMLMGVGAIAGVIGLALTFVLGRNHDAEVLYHSYLVSAFFFLTIALGGMFLTLALHLTKAGWGIVVRRLAEAAGTCVLPLALLFIPIITLGMEPLYSDWIHPHGHHAAIVANKEPWLNQPFFIARIIIYFAVWIILSQLLFRTSTKQDMTGDAKLSNRMEAISAPGVILFALTITLAAFDLLMSLRPEWFSTIFGVYAFAGSALGIAAFLILTLTWLQSTGRLQNAIHAEHYHDLGKLLFAFGIVFWAYIGFSQFMLIWYANIPEETGWFQHHAKDPVWRNASWILLFGHFFVPFLLLLSRHIKRSKPLLALGAIYMLAIHWFDIFWVVMPQMTPAEGEIYAAPPLAASQLLLHACPLIGIGGVFLAFFGFSLRNCSLVAERDPRLAESLAFENF